MNIMDCAPYSKPHKTALAIIFNRSLENILKFLFSPYWFKKENQKCCKIVHTLAVNQKTCGGGACVLEVEEEILLGASSDSQRRECCLQRRIHLL
jgi:hypothetical protein